ncbi:MAG: UbiD family decarboxylase [Geoalkalibacter sp.]|uniref:UbiD family decarboxylase n=1 Tax=Geoalkalibacter sp. TaxID=3041440 RepID=UPI003D0D45BC
MKAKLLSNKSRSLKSFLQLLDSQGDLHHVRTTVSCNQEIAAITDRICKSTGGGQALLFESVRESRYPVVTNLFGSARRAAFAWGRGASFQDIAKLINNAPGRGSDERLHHLVQLRRRCSEGTGRFDLPLRKCGLTSLPALQNWPGDGGRFLTLALVYLRDPQSQRINCGIYRMQILDDDRAAIRFLPGSDGARIFEAYAQANRSMPVAVTLGSDPAWVAAAAFPLPMDVAESDFARWLSDRSLTSAQGPLTDLTIPADAEFVLEGVMCPEESILEGPFGNHTGYYATPTRAAVFHLQALYHGEDPVFPATVVGPPPMENVHLMRGSEPLTLALLNVDYPCIERLRFIEQGIFHGCTILGVDTSQGQCPFDLAHALWRRGPLKRSRLLIFCNCEMEIEPLSVVLWRLINRIDPEKDILIEHGRMAIDSTRPAGGPSVKVSPVIEGLINRRWHEYGF